MRHPRSRTGTPSVRLSLGFIALLGIVLPGSAQSPTSTYPPMPEAFSSFGAAVADGHVYVYGGHVGRTHTYSTDAVTGKFRRLNIAAPKAWQELPAGPGLQGLALVSHGGKLYRIGGMQPRNKPGEPSDNISLASCARFDPKVGKWEDIPSLPAGRSSHDASVVGDLIVVVGGWQLNGQGMKAKWHDTTLILDLTKKKLQWEAIPQPFQRRALNTAALEGKVFVLCGMGPENDTEKTVNVLDPKTRRWSQAPAIPGPIRNAFTPAACATAGRLYVSPTDGKVYRLNEKQNGWDEVASLEKKRIVHRIVPATDDLILVLGGGGMGANLAHVEAIIPSKLTKAKSAVLSTGTAAQVYCPIMTSIPIEADSKEVEYRGVKIKICCGTCVKKWNADPEAYLNVAFLPQLKGMTLPKRTIAQVFCPVYPDRVVSPMGPSAEHQGTTIYFFNETARARFLANPAQYTNVGRAPR